MLKLEIEKYVHLTCIKDVCHTACPQHASIAEIKRCVATQNAWEAQATLVLMTLVPAVIWNLNKKLPFSSEKREFKSLDLSTFVTKISGELNAIFVCSVKQPKEVFKLKFDINWDFQCFFTHLDNLELRNLLSSSDQTTEINIVKTIFLMLFAMVDLIEILGCRSAFRYVKSSF
jgi:hypothetical protein